jgi:NADH-quinone oxidoreductase subunit J
MLDSFLYQICLDNFLFFIFSIVLVISALAIIIVNNSIYSVLFLVLNFVTSASLLFLLECEFISLLFIIIYVGAIAVLFLFVVMMLDVKVIESSKDLFKYLPIGSIVGLLFFIEITSVIYNSFLASPYLTKAAGIEYSNIYYNWYSKIDVLTDINSLGQILYTHYLLQFLIAGFILLLAVIGAVVLTMSNNAQKTKNQVFFKQISRSSKNILLV